MNSLLANFDIDKPQNFWKLYPSWKTPKVFNELYKSDKSKDKNQSSLIMWAIVHMFDKSESNPWRTQDYEEKIEIINEDLMNNRNFDWEAYQNVIDEMEKCVLREEERTYHAFIKFMEKRRKFIEDQQDDLNFETLKQLDDAIKRNGEIMKELDRLKAAVMMSEDAGKVKGDRTESANELGLI
jgi:hypothetical protein